MMKMKAMMQKTAGFLAGVAALLFLILFIGIGVSSHFVTAQQVVWDIQPPDQILFWPDNPLVSAGMTVLMLMVMLVVHEVLKRVKKIPLIPLLCAAWMAAALFWVWGSQLEPHADFGMVVDSAKEFAVGDFSIFTEHVYYHECTYQLGVCIVLEALVRLFPFMNLAVGMQMINVALTMLIVIALNKFMKEINGEEAYFSYGQYFLFLPMIFFCSYVYGTLPMMLLIASSYLCFAYYMRRQKLRYGILCALCIGLAAMIKPNAMIAVAALGIIAVLEVMQGKDWKLLLAVLLGAMLAVILPKAVARFYEIRSGVEFGENISMLARLTMGFQEARSGPGWYNNYVTDYSPMLYPGEEGRILHLNNLMARMKEFAQDPMMFVRFMRDKCYSMWLEPTYSTLWNGSLSVKNGPLNGMVIRLCREGMPLRALLERYMDAFQQAMYVLVCLGAVKSFKKRNDPVQILLPVLVLGGFLYHMLFEAKSQYIFVYAFFLMPLAAQGLEMLTDWLKGVFKRSRKKA